MHCETPIFLAYLMAAYAGASVLYLLITREMGTPFRDSLTPAQVRIKRQESRKRGIAFLSSFGVCLALLVAIRPFAPVAHTPQAVAQAST